MTITRRHILAGAIAAPAIIGSARRGSAAVRIVKISHQFPGGTIDEGDFRDRLCRMFAAELEKRTNGALAAQVYPNSSLMKTVAQFSAVRKGALDLSLYPISYAGGEFAGAQYRPDAGTGQLLQAGRRLEDGAGRPEIRRIPGEKGVIILSWIWQAGGVASRSNADRQPGGRQGPEGARRQPRDGHGAAGGRRDHAVARRRTNSMRRCRPAPATRPSPPPPA